MVFTAGAQSKFDVTCRRDFSVRADRERPAVVRYVVNTHDAHHSLTTCWTLRCDRATGCFVCSAIELSLIDVTTSDSGFYYCYVNAPLDRIDLFAEAVWVSVFGKLPQAVWVSVLGKLYETMVTIPVTILISAASVVCCDT